MLLSYSGYTICLPLTLWGRTWPLSRMSHPTVTLSFSSRPVATPPTHSSMHQVSRSTCMSPPLLGHFGCQYSLPPSLKVKHKRLISFPLQCYFLPPTMKSESTKCVSMANIITLITHNSSVLPTPPPLTASLPLPLTSTAHPPPPYPHPRPKRYWNAELGHLSLLSSLYLQCMSWFLIKV